MHTESLEQCFARVIEETEALTNDINRSLDIYQSSEGQGPAHERILELGSLLANVRDGSAKAESLLKKLPSPNQVPSYLSEAVATIATSLFRFLDTCREREAIIRKMAASIAKQAA